MKDILIHPQFLKGQISVPASKSLLHRTIICASFADGITRISNLNFCDDVLATINVLKRLGTDFEIQGSELYVNPITNNFINNSELIFDCKESASTLRFIIPILLVLNVKATLVGANRLLKRPLEPYLKLFDDKIKVFSDKITIDKITTIDGFSKKFEDNKIQISGNISSQFISGLMLPVPLLNQDIEILITDKLESTDYVSMTEKIMQLFGIDIKFKDNLIKIKKSRFKSANICIESDYSSAAFWIASGALNGDITINHLSNSSLQGDSQILDIVKKFKADISFNNENLRVKKSKLVGTKIDAANIPDLVPVLCILGSLSHGETIIENVNRLRYKESDRIQAILTNLTKIGANIEYKNNNFIIQGKNFLDGGIVDSFNDHRIAMAMSVAAIKCKDNVIIRNGECVKKSYPGFFRDYQKLGEQKNVVYLG